MERTESDAWLRDDLQIARLTVAHAARGDAVECSPHVLASYEVLGVHPDKVWPKILARREALLGPCCAKVAAIPKKPPQSVKLWSENTNGARAVNSCAGETLLRDTNSGPMAAPSVAELYRDSVPHGSAKTRRFTYEELVTLVRLSYAPESVKRGTLNALSARGAWPHEDGPAHSIICVALDGMALGNADGAGNCVRRTAQRRVKKACELGFWRQTHKLNRWLPCPKCGTERQAAKCPSCSHKGRSLNPDGTTNMKEFCRPFTYEIDIEKFRTAPAPKGIRHFCARTWKEHKEAAKRGEHPNVTEMPARKPAQPVEPPKPPAPAAPLPQREKPAAEHRSPERSPDRRITRDERTALFNTYLALKKTGMEHGDAVAEVHRQFHDRYSPEEIDWAVKIVSGGKVDSPPEPRGTVVSEKCGKCGAVLTQNLGPGPRLKCPRCP